MIRCLVPDPMPIPEKEPSAERDFRSFVTFGTDEGRPPDDALQRFYKHSQALAVAVPIKVRGAFMALEHDMTAGSDHLFLIEGLVCQGAAEVLACDSILRAKMAPLTMFHHARALYEAHAMMYWLLGDIPGRSLRLLKDYLKERAGFERAAEESIGKVATDIKAAGHALLNDPVVRPPPSVHDQGIGHPILEFDYAMFWKYASAHTHTGNIGTGEIDSENERTMILQIMGGTIRHAAGVYRHVVSRFKLDLGAVGQQLTEAEEYARYRFSGAPIEPGTKATTT